MCLYFCVSRSCVFKGYGKCLVFGKDFQSSLRNKEVNNTTKRRRPLHIVAKNVGTDTIGWRDGYIISLIETQGEAEREGGGDRLIWWCHADSSLTPLGGRIMWRWIRVA